MSTLDVFLMLLIGLGITAVRCGFSNRLWRQIWANARQVGSAPPRREPAPPRLAERLASLDDLRDREVIGLQEYAERRQRILDDAAGRPR